MSASSVHRLLEVVNRALAQARLPDFIRVVDAGYSSTGAITAVLEKEALGSMLVPSYDDLLITAVRQADPAVISAELPEQWYRVKVHGVPTRRYFSCGLSLAKEEIALGTRVRLKGNPTWLRRQGSPVSPILFLIYLRAILDIIEEVVPGVRLLSFADDMGFWRPHTRSKNEKTEAVLFTRKRGQGLRSRIQRAEITVGGHAISFNPEATRWLGIWLDVGSTPALR
ncbi:hypothetical protein N7451_012095 [Penicillium sp. IBT 35674x]|nr:hypothetical protein N7451_012095 [Penicillium sp. IBT 35674x]